ncbi:MAG: hypothetical protein RLZZ450_4334 [Pseudomonadota bacterium]|jgi:hypothetical protein
MIHPSKFKSANGRSLLAGTILLAGCAGNDPVSPSSTALGSRAGGVGLALTVSDGSDVECVNYEVSRDGIALRSGTLAISPDGHVTGIIAGLDSGSGYRLDLEAPRKRPKEGDVPACLGAASFGVVTDQTTALSVFLHCDDTSPQQNVNIVGDLNFCPKITCASALPNSVAVGSSVELTATAEDKEHDPLTYAWSKGAAFSEDTVFATGSSASFTCAAAGTFELNVRVRDREVAGCSKTLPEPIIVTCVAPAVEGNAADCGVPAPSKDRR